ncbi:ABC transporter permease [Massilia sp. WF1]|uniref:cytochrome C assembly family protein n=1 Tax=unclassified Massilia TaxID=2609279 RepID=UPI00064A769B|nr:MULTISPECIES: cytochrome c biogenesis protein CcsA [unclassified Massilia]ALK98881.1 ABC transporter permease [Massilia sp. WG5]KLU38571.1 ABC transporter permease [Massilia sp. WF1]
MQTTFFIAAAILYAVCVLLPAQRGGVVSGVTLLAWVLHGAALWPDMLSNGTLRVGFAFMLSSALWISVAAWWIENRNIALDGMRRMIMPCAAVSALLPPLFPGSLMPVGEQTPAFGWHVAVAIMAYSTLTIAAFHAVLMALQETRLHTRSAKKGWLGAAIDQLPALLTMEKLLFRMIGIGFVLLSLTVLSGIVFSEQLFGRALRWDHKNFFALLSWLLFAALLAGRRWRGWRGKTALRFTLAGFATLALAYVGSRFVFEVVLHRGFT